MIRVEIISASAGTGKTTRLARVIAEAVASHEARPEAVLATTFTRRAAAELSERARARLLADGRVEEARRLTAARIGTVNAVCGALVQAFSFERGLSPRLRVLDEWQADAMLRQALAHAIPQERVEELDELTSRFQGRDPEMFYAKQLDWREPVREIIALARANNLASERFPEFAERSWRMLEGQLGRPQASAPELDDALDRAMREFLTGVDLAADRTETTRRFHASVQRWERQGACRLRWADWLGLASDEPGKRSALLASPLHEAAEHHDRHPRLHGDLQRLTWIVFDVARLALDAYQEHKRRLGAIDFVDQEAFALALLRTPEIRERLADELDLVVVDEFQDTSPIQLAIFLELAAIAPRSVWVGDPKQAIYGFRGADPALMDAVVDQLLGGRSAETLGRSFRSRPRLVELTTALFAEAFEGIGFRREWVAVEPARPESPSELGPVVERWLLTAGGGRASRATDIEALAAGVRSLLDDPRTRVVDPASKVARAPKPGDVAVLCPTHEQCRALADALARLGLQAVVARPGVVGTLEGRLVLGALRLWSDPHDDLARAELARLLEHPAEGDEWLAVLLAAREAGHPPFADLPGARAVESARIGRSSSGVLAGFDAALAALDVREHCLRLGEAEIRLGNLDALRAHAVAYVSTCRTEGRACTIEGLIDYFHAIAAEGADGQAADSRASAVVVSTWHGAKGLEWPITVLADLSRVPESPILGVHLVGDRDAIDLSDPLVGRWIRYWPDPYLPRSTRAPLYERLAEHPVKARAEQRQRREALRLLYVGWTRARDRIVLAARPDGIASGRFAALQRATGEELLVEPDESGHATWAGQPVDLLVRSLEPMPHAPEDREPGRAPRPTGPRLHPPSIRTSSMIEGTGSVRETFDLGGRLDLRAASEAMAAVGEAIHAFFAADRSSFAHAERLEAARRCLERWAAREALAEEDLLHAADRLWIWIQGRYPGARILREWPLEQREHGGTILRGRADLVLATPAGSVVVDHKAFPGDRSRAQARAAQHAGQLRAYAEAMERASGRPLLATYIHLPVSGLLIEVA